MPMYAIRLTTKSTTNHVIYWYGDDGYTMDEEEAAQFRTKERAEETIIYFRMKNSEVTEI